MTIKYYCKICFNKKELFLSNSVRKIRLHLKEKHKKKITENQYYENKLFGMIK